MTCAASNSPDPKGTNVMKFFVSVFVTVLALFWLPLTPSEAQNLTIAISSQTSDAERQEQGEAVLRFLASSVEPGQSAEIVDAYDLTPVATFSVPEGRAYQNPRAKIAVNRQAAAQILRLEPDLARSANEVQRPINLPGLLRYLGEACSLDGGHDLVIIGSPLYDMPREPGVSMREGRVPGDGLIQGTRGSSPFGADGMGDRLAGVRVHFIALDPGWALNDRHAFAVERFTALLVDAFGADLVSFSNDMDSGFASVAAQASAPDRGFILEETDKMEMLIFASEMGPIASGRDMDTGRRFYVGPPMINDRVEIGLYWPCSSCDLDIYARPHDDAQIVYYGRISTPQGRFFKAFRMGSEDHRAQEQIVLDGPIDLSALRIWVNFYGGRSSGGAEAELRITIGGETYTRPLRIPANAGNGGAGQSAVTGDGADNPAWVAIEPLSLLRE
ncbi:hypothetical protein [Maricaulis virginensis]|nr:hypothetical protein [Maricaulis virginensis]